MAFRHIKRYSNYTKKDDGYCVHGVYVGGIGIDWMCGHCEMDEFDYGVQDMGIVHITCKNPDTGTVVDWRESMLPLERAEESAEMWTRQLQDHVVDLVVEVEKTERGVWYNRNRD